MTISKDDAKGDARGDDSKSLDSLRSRIDDAESSRSKQEDNRGSNAHLPAGAIAFVGRVAIELVAGVAVGGFIGWLLDDWLGTTPLLMLLLFFLGAGAGMMNIWRMASGHGLKVGYFDHRDGQDEDTKGTNTKGTNPRGTKE